MSSTERPTRTGDLHHDRKRSSMPPPRSPSAVPSCAISSPRRSASGGPDTTPGSRSVRCPASRSARRSLCDLPQPGGGAVRRRDSEGLLLGCATSTAGSSRSSRSIARTSAAPSAGSPSPTSSCALATAARTMPTVPALPGLRSAGSSSTRYKIEGRHALHRGRADAHAGQAPAGESAVCGDRHAPDGPYRPLV